MTRPVTSQPLATLSPARLERLLCCPLRVAFEQQGQGDRHEPPSPAALVGVAIHRAIELILRKKAEGPDDAWKRACDELADKGGDPRVFPTARRARLRLERRLPELLAYIDARSPVELLVEEPLTSRDGTIHGRPDLLILGPHPTIVDFKTGRVTGEDDPHPAYERQLTIYAWLAASCLGIDVDAALFSLREGIVPIDVSPPLRAQLMTEAMTARDDFNARAPGPQPGRPHEDHCRWCPFGCSCDDLWAALAAGEVDSVGWGEAVRGEVTANVVTTAIGVAALPINLVEGTRRGLAVVIDVPEPVASGLQIGDYLAFIGLGLRSDSPLTLVWSDLTSRFEKLLMPPAGSTGRF
jgi:hypothetical protein